MITIDYNICGVAASCLGKRARFKMRTLSSFLARYPSTPTFLSPNLLTPPQKDNITILKI